MLVYSGCGYIEYMLSKSKNDGIAYRVDINYVEGLIGVDVNCQS